MTADATRRRAPRRTPKNPEGRMTLVEHLRELRNRLFKAALAIVACAVVGYIFFNPIFHFLSHPYCRLPAAHGLHGNGKCNLQVTQPLDFFMLKLKVAFIVGLVLACPVWLYQLWAFITPGLHRNERKWAMTFLALAIPLFVAGCGLAFYAISHALAFLMPGSSGDVYANLEVTKYFSFVLGMLLMFGIGFEFPLLVVLLNVVGVVSDRRWRKWRRGVIFLLFVFAAIATPDGTGLSMIMLAIPLVVLYEIALIFTRAHDKRKEARRQAFLDQELQDMSESEAT
ncbi:MAG: twin-arginine translocase subunit TatC [Mycobacteriales bacterium]